MTPVETAFLQATQTGDTLTGSLTQVIADTFTSTTTSSVINFTGAISGSSVTLNLIGSTIRGASEITGARNPDGSLTLTYPAYGGQIATLQFVPATVDDYNAAVATLEATEEAAREATAQASAAAASAAAESSCATQVTNHDAIVIVRGPGADTECLRIATTINFSGAPWGAVIRPAPDTVRGVSIVCGGTIGQLRVVVWDSWTASYGTATCNALPLVVAFIGVNNYTPAAGGLRLIGGTDANNNPYPAIVPGSPADQAGLQENNIITAIDGVSVSSGQDLTNILAYDSPGQVVEVAILRNAAPATIQLTLGTRPQG